MMNSNSKLKRCLLAVHSNIKSTLFEIVMWAKIDFIPYKLSTYFECYVRTNVAFGLAKK